MANYVAVGSVGELIGKSFSIYLRHFGTILLIYIVLAIPLAAMLALLQMPEFAGLIANGISATLSIIISFIAAAVLTVTISDICLGNKPTFERSYVRAFQIGIGKFLGTILLVWLMILLGIILFVIPGLIISVMLVVVMPVLILERIAGWKAVKRTLALARGKHWRNFGVVLVVSLIVQLFAYVTGFALGALFADFVVYGDEFALWIFLFVASLVGLLIGPVQSVAAVLLYYDLRSRKEAFDLVGLERDLNV